MWARLCGFALDWLLSYQGQRDALNLYKLIRSLLLWRRRRRHYAGGELGMANLGNPVNFTLPNASASLGQPVLRSNPNRKRAVIQNLGPGIVYLAPKDNGSTLQGIQVVSGSNFADDPPFVHCGEWWAQTDTAATVITVAEWS